MKKRKYFMLCGLIASTLLTACSNTEIPENVGETEVSKNVEQTEKEKVQGTISPDSREAVIRSLGYDTGNGQTGSVFVVHISDELEEKEQILKQISSSKYCKEWKAVYSMVADVQLQKEQLREEWMEWNDKQKDNFTIEEQLEHDGFINPFRSIYSTPEQKETIITASQVKETDIQGYTGQLAVTCKEGDAIKARYIPSYVDMEERDTIKAKKVNIDKITMDTPWWINKEAYGSEPILILSWEKYEELLGEEAGNCFYVFRDGGQNQELRALVEELTKEYGSGDRMILWQDPYFEPTE